MGKSIVRGFTALLVIVVVACLDKLIWGDYNIPALFAVSVAIIVQNIWEARNDA